MNALTDRQTRMLGCMHDLDRAGKSALLAYYTDRFEAGETHEHDMMEYLSRAVTALGYRLEPVQREEPNGEGQ